MKKILCITVVFVLLISSAFADGTSVRANCKLFTRSGPNTGYTELGGYDVEGQYFTPISRCSGNGVWWLQVEVVYRGRPVRIYTGKKRFDISDAQLYPIREERLLYSTSVQTVSNVYTGPGSNYHPLTTGYPGKGSEIYMQAGTYVDVFAKENGDVQVDFTQNSVRYRGWISEDCLAPAYINDSGDGSCIFSCVRCLGSGICDVCGGSGERMCFSMYCNNGYCVADHSPYKRSCRFCVNGKCGECGGSGIVSCERCGGTGACVLCAGSY